MGDTMTQPLETKTYEPWTHQIPNNLENEMRRHRRELHRIPEIGFDLVKTYAYLRKELLSYGYELETVAKTGIVAYKRGRLSESLAFRADMDGLEIQEGNSPFASEHIGRMHACGHDGHMAILLGLAKRLSKANLHKSLVLLFQPAEETAGGAKVFIDDGVLDRYNIRHVFGLHLYPELEEGVIGTKAGLLMGKDGEFDVHIEGRNAHGSQPHLGRDALTAAAQLINQYQTLLPRTVSKDDAFAINIGTFHGGEARNVIGKDAFMQGSIRTFDQDTFDAMTDSMRRIDKGIEYAYDVTVQNDIRSLYPPLINDEHLYHMLKPVFAGQNTATLSPLLLAEDFSFFSQKVPSLFFMLGSRNVEKGFVHPLHSDRFDFDDTLLAEGLKTFLRIGEEMGLY